MDLPYNTYSSSFDYLRGTMNVLWHPPIFLLIGILGILATRLDPCRSSGSLPLIRILATDPDPCRSSGSLPLIRILGVHPDPWCSSGSLLVGILDILTAHPILVKILAACLDPPHNCRIPWPLVFGHSL